MPGIWYHAWYETGTKWYFPIPSHSRDNIFFARTRRGRKQLAENVL